MDFRRLRRPRPEPTPPAAQPITVAVPAPPKPEPKGFSTGTGFFVTTGGDLVTNAHVVKGCSDIAVKTDDGTISPAVELASDATNDLALLKVKKTRTRFEALRHQDGVPCPTKPFRVINARCQTSQELQHSVLGAR